MVLKASSTCNNEPTGDIMVSSSTCTNEPFGEDLCARSVVVKSVGDLDHNFMLTVCGCG